MNLTRRIALAIAGCLVLLSTLAAVASLGTEAGNTHNPSILAEPREQENVERLGFVEGHANAVVIRNYYAYVAEWPDLFRVIDVTKPNDPQKVAELKLQGNPLSIAISDTYAYVADDRGLSIIDIASSTEPALTGRLNTSDAASGVAVVDYPGIESSRYAFLANNFMGILAVNVTIPKSPVIEFAYKNKEWSSIFDVTAKGYYAYVADKLQGLRVVDVTTPAAPEEVGKCALLPGLEPRVTVSGTQVYVADGFRYLHIIDISKPAEPKLSKTYTTTGSAADVALYGDIAYVADGISGVRVIDVKEPTNPMEVGYYAESGGNANGVAVDEKGLIYLADKLKGLFILQFIKPEPSSTPTATRTAISTSTPTSTTTRTSTPTASRTATATATTTPTLTATPSPPPTITPTPTPTLGFGKTVEPGRARAGDVLTYTLTLSNTQAAAVSLHMTDTLPSETTFVDGSVKGPGATYSDTLRAVLWTGSLLPGASQQISFTVSVNSSITNTMIVNRAILRDGGMTREASVWTIVGHLKLYLPTIYRNWPPPEAPQLQPISAPEANATYQVAWTNVESADSYELQQATDSDFTDATLVFAGSVLSHTVPSQGIATYYYRVRAFRGGLTSRWSRPQSVEVRWEEEPNDSYTDAEIHYGGPLSSGKKYYGYQDDQKDYFYFNTTNTGRIVVELTGYSGTGVQLQLFRGIPSAGSRVALRMSPPYHLEYNGGPGRYYVYIYTESGFNRATPYELTATFP